MKRFIFDSILDEENICNLEKEKHKITKGVDHGLKLLVYGKRNMGKTSLVKNVIANNTDCTNFHQTLNHKPTE